MWNGNQRGSSMHSTGMTGTARQGTWPNSAMAMRVKTLAFAAPPCPSTQARGTRHVRRVRRRRPISFSAQ